MYTKCDPKPFYNALHSNLMKTTEQYTFLKFANDAHLLIFLVVKNLKQKKNAHNALRMRCECDTF